MMKETDKPEEMLMWHWGSCWYNIGKSSGEAVDFFQALEKFRSAVELGCDTCEFHNDYANALVDLSCLIGRKDLLVEATEHYTKSTTLSPKQYEIWVNLGCANQRLYDLGGPYEYFLKADQCFEEATELKPDESMAWFRWAILYSSLGKTTRDVERLQSSLSKYERANECEPDCSPIYLRWGEAQMFLGAFTENLELLRAAEAKISVALNHAPEQAETWYAYGVCLNEFGRYFASEEYYQQAIEKFQYGLSLSPNNFHLHHGIALAHFAIGEITDDVAMIEKSVRFCSKAFELGGQSNPHFLSDWGVALMKLGEMTIDKTQIEAASEKFEQAIAKRLESPQGEEVEIEWLYNYGCAMDFLGDFHEDAVYYERAVQVLSHVVSVDPDYTHAKYNLALALSHLAELNADVDTFHKAVDLFHDLVQQDPEDEMAWNDYGLTLLNLAVLVHDPVHSLEGHKLFEQAEAKLLQAVALGNIAAFYNLACCYALTGNLSAAIHYLERAEQNDALPMADDVLHDEWLDSLRNQPAYRQLISRLLNNQKPE
jgi:tetratricopeptide (TPR) repeat protein